jgi:thioredoxin 1
MAQSHVSDASFDQDVLKSDEPVLVDFWAEWCSPCKQIAPVLEEIAEEMAGKLRIAKFNVDENPQVPSSYGVRAIPTLILFKNGEAVGTQVGVQPKSRLVAWINDSI